MNTDSGKIIVGVSGGVDSSVALLLLLEQGHDVEAVFMKNWEADDTDEYCAAAKDLEDAQQICDKLNVKLHSVNFADQYWDRVFKYFLDEYNAGRTPNPDVLCNKEIKFKAFLDYALSIGGNKIATGHYAGVQQKENLFHLTRGHDTDKDQSYFLYLLNQHQLSHALFPLADLPKSEVRTIAQQHGLVTHDKKDSTGICFIGERRFKDFLQTYIPAKPGEIVTEDGTVIGQHDGLMYHTIGQRKGLKIGGTRNSDGSPWYVAAKDINNNQLIVVQNHEHPLLYKYMLTVEQMHWIATVPQAWPYKCTAKTRYRQSDAACTVLFDGSTYTVEFEQAQWAVTPGQSIVFYDKEICLGGGIIK